MSISISCVEGSVQSGMLRFRQQDPRPPQLRHWRCELTALSKVHNLYFVACVDTIHIYQPTFPNQTISDDPFILFPPVSSPNLHGHIDDDSPHSINRLHVDFFGREEILLVACDDGDVVGYRVQKIQDVVERRVNLSKRGQGPLEDDVQIPTFFHRNVGRSAWGLAVHREARMIAISANTRLVTVIAFALTEPTDSDSSSSAVRNHGDTRGFPYSRERDHTIVLRAQSNIPSVAFDNSSLDLSGNWLFGSSIDGKAMIWDLFSQQYTYPVREISVGFCAGDRSFNRSSGIVTCNCPEHRGLPHAAWAMLPLDPRSFRVLESVDAMFQGREEKLGRFWKLRRWRSDNEKERVTDDESSVFMVSDDGDDDDDMDDMDDMDDGHDDGGDETQSYEAANIDVPDESLFIPENDNQSSLNFSNSNQFTQDELEAMYDYSMMDYFCETMARGSCITTSLSPCLIVTKHEIYLIQRPLSPSTDTDDVILTMKSPLGYDEFESEHLQDRLCLSTQIPELGIFIVASPSGGVAILSLTQTWNEKTQQVLYGFQYEHKLEGVFSKQKLAGIAVGPVQGMLDIGDEKGPEDFGARRWRLFLMYVDHTKVCYQLERRARDDDDDVSRLAELVV
ncbi:hypothetical protein K504DRAFT_404323 [Pleomassaria siparia CBS 279.74]|uniref:WD40 repeat-like protein n=1 Tax=Pleomassaria siparia CBS 279.74 TaxID=1314801 RepID=A0A6G1KEB8_9PLEO|nr:hypothetical protein K504DRAFT_404323 [Pleomassaria siparia CBS 279.74]